MSIVEIPPGSGNKYRYVYDQATQQTQYKGPVGEAPALDEGEFLEIMKVVGVRERDRRVTYVEGKRIVVPGGENVYLGRPGQVRDFAPKGLSDVREVKNILIELDEDMDEGVNRGTIHARSMRLKGIVEQTSKMTNEQKKKAIVVINKWRDGHGWKPLSVAIRKGK